MPSRKLRVFLDTSVILEYIKGKAELQRLFSDEVRKRAVFTINVIVLQELLLSRDAAASGADLNAVLGYLEVVDVANISSPEIQAEMREARNRLVHANDILILAAARSCDVLLTYDPRKLPEYRQSTAVRSETPEEFLDELDTAA